MRTRLLSVTVAAALAVACGAGRAILIVDVLSFLQPTGNDTLHYTVPGGVSGTVSDTAHRFNMPGGFGKSAVDTVQLSGAANLVNNTGAGSVGFKIFLAADSALVYTTTPFIQGSAMVANVDTVPVADSAVFVGDTLFNHNQIWVGVQVNAAANAGPPLDGKVRVTKLLLRIVLQDKIF